MEMSPQCPIILLSSLIDRGRLRVQRGERQLKKLLIILSLVLIAVLPLLSGCGNNKQTIESEQGPITIEQKGQDSSEVGMGNTKADVGEEKQPSAEDLGLPIYDGAEYVPGSGIPATITSDSGNVNLIEGEFTTTDLIGKVADWYKAKLGEPGINGENEKSWIFKTDDQGSNAGVTLKVEEDKVKITIWRMSRVPS